MSEEIESQDDIIEPEEKIDEVEGDKEVKEKEEIPEPKLVETPEAKKARLERELARVNKKLGVTEQPKPVEKTTVSKTGELDETQLGFLDLKGITDDEEIDVIQKVMRNTGQTLRQALKDDYVVSKLAALRENKERQDATPSNNHRSGGQPSNDVDYWVAKAEQSGELPKDPELKMKVLDRISKGDDLRTPPWKR